MNREFYKTVSIGPYRRVVKSASTYMVSFWALLCPQIIMLAVTQSYQSLLIILCAILGAAATEYKNFIERVNAPFYIAYSVLTGTLIGFYLPATFPPVAVFFLTFLLMFTAKTVFGKQGVSWINPVALTLAGAWFVGHFYFPEFQIDGNDLLLKNPSLNLIQSSFIANAFDENITSFLNNTVFSMFNVSIPNGYVSLFWDNQSIIPAFRFTALTLLASMFLFAFDLEKGIVPFIYLLVYALLVKFVSPFLTGGIPFSGDMLLALLSSGTLFTTFFILQWQGTLPYSLGGKIFYAICGGIMAFAFCGTGTSPIGSIITILFLNLLTPAIILYENRTTKRKVSLLLGGNN